MLIHTKIKLLMLYVRENRKDLNIEELVRCHKSYIINLNYVENIKSNTVILDSQEEVPISRYRYKDIKERFLKFIGDRIC
ncbi:LytTR family transcriptional regulator [Clostridioides difficile]|nr:LytTR family transcriptional regulator [Clostridioides difficile]